MVHEVHANRNSHDGRPHRGIDPRPVWAWALAAVALFTLFLLTQENGALMGMRYPETAKMKEPLVSRAGQVLGGMGTGPLFGLFRGGLQQGSTPPARRDGLRQVRGSRRTRLPCLYPGPGTQDPRRPAGRGQPQQRSAAGP